MTRKQALIELRDKVEAGGDTPGEVLEIETALNVKPLGGHVTTLWKAARGSLDAAKSLHEAVLGCKWSWNVYDEGQASVAMGGSAEDGAYFGKFSDTPARAWLLAILEALIAQEGEA